MAVFANPPTPQLGPMVPPAQPVPGTPIMQPTPAVADVNAGPAAPPPGYQPAEGHQQPYYPQPVGYVALPPGYTAPPPPAWPTPLPPNGAPPAMYGQTAYQYAYAPPMVYDQPTDCPRHGEQGRTGGDAKTRIFVVQDQQTNDPEVAEAKKSLKKCGKSQSGMGVLMILLSLCVTLIGAILMQNHNSMVASFVWSLICTIVQMKSKGLAGIFFGGLGLICEAVVFFWGCWLLYLANNDVSQLYQILWNQTYWSAENAGWNWFTRHTQGVLIVMLLINLLIVLLRCAMVYVSSLISRLHRIAHPRRRC